MHRVSTFLYRLLVRACLALPLVSMATTADSGTVPLPRLPDGPIELRVAHVVNPRLPAMNAQQIQTLLAAAAREARAHFGVELRFTEPRQIEIGALFDTIPARQRVRMSRDIFDFKSGQRDTRRLAQAFGQGFRRGREALEGMAGYARNHTPDVNDSSYEAFGASMAALQLARIDQWRTRRALDGGLAIDDLPYNEFSLWLALGWGELPYELIITNQLIASVEYSWPAVHAAVRGGYTNGITSYGGMSRFGTFSVWSTYAYTGNDDFLVRMRGDEAYTPEEAAELAGIGAVHELGHQLFHLLHPFGQAACIMNPVPMFSYRAWAKALAPESCRLGSSPPMTPGAHRFDY